MMALTGVEQDDWSIEFDAEHMHFGQDGLDDFDWSNKADDEPIFFALMATNSRRIPYYSKCRQSRGRSQGLAIIGQWMLGSKKEDKDKLLILKSSEGGLCGPLERLKGKPHRHLARRLRIRAYQRTSDCSNGSSLDLVSVEKERIGSTLIEAARNYVSEFLLPIQFSGKQSIQLAMSIIEYDQQVIVHTLRPMPPEESPAATKLNFAHKGSRQEEGVDYDEVFAPVAELESNQTLFAFCIFHGLYCLSDGCQKVHFCMAHHRRGSKAWFVLKSSLDLPRFYGDRILKIFANDFKMSSMGELTFFLGLQVKQSNGGIFLSQAICAAILNKKDEEGDDVELYSSHSKGFSSNAVKGSLAFSDSGLCWGQTMTDDHLGEDVNIGRRIVSWQCKETKNCGLSPLQKPPNDRYCSSCKLLCSDGRAGPQDFIPSVSLPSKVVFTFYEAHSTKFSCRITPLTPSMLEVVTALAAEEEQSTSPHSRAASSARDAQGTPTQSAAHSQKEVRRLKKQTLSQAKQILKLKAKLKKLSKFVKPVVKYHALWLENQNLKKQKRQSKRHKKKVSSMLLLLLVWKGKSDEDEEVILRRRSFYCKVVEDTGRNCLRQLKVLLDRVLLPSRILDFEDWIAGPSSPLCPIMLRTLKTIRTLKEKLLFNKSELGKLQLMRRLLEKFKLSGMQKKNRKRFEGIEENEAIDYFMTNSYFSLLQERNQYDEFLKDSFKDFIPMDSEKEREMMKEREAKRLLRKRKATISEELPSKKPKLRTETMDELRNYLRVVDFEKNAQDRESLEGISMITELQVIDSPDGEYLIIHRANNHFRAFDTLWEILHILDRQDLYHLYRVVQDYYEHIPPTGLGLILLGDLTIIWETAESSDDDFWKDQEEWEIIRWRFHESSGVHTLELEDGTMIHMLAERRYPLSRELMIRMLDHGMEVEDENETAITLIHLFILWTTEDGDNS
ncbi:ribonuclease H-like domain-containing protein [Tanacetum coccineum]